MAAESSALVIWKTLLLYDIEIHRLLVNENHRTVKLCIWIDKYFSSPTLHSILFVYIHLQLIQHVQTDFKCLTKLNNVGRINDLVKIITSLIVFLFVSNETLISQSLKMIAVCQRRHN